MKPYAKGKGHRTPKHPAPYRPSPKQVAKFEHSLAQHPVPPGGIRLYCIDPLMDLYTDLGDHAPLASNGYGGWSAVDRPRRVQETTWQGRQLFQIVLSVLFDVYTDPDPRADVEAAFKVLEKMAEKSEGATEPPILTLDGGGAIPHDVHNDPEKFWVIQDIQPTLQEWNDEGNRNRVEATVTFWEYSPDVFVNGSAKKHAATNKHGRGASRKIYVVHSGDTLLKIAQRELHNAQRWGEIARLNHIRDPKAIHAGERLKLP